MPSLKQKQKAKRVIVEIVRSSGGTFENKTNLFKAFYYAHLEFARKHSGCLTTWPIVRMPYGPGIDDADTLLGELVAEHILHLGTVQKGDCVALRCELTPKASELSPLAPDEVDAIRAAVEKVSGQTAKRVSDQSHVDSRSWNDAKDGEELNIYADLLSPDEYERLHADAAKLGEKTKLFFANQS
ncbi:MAG: hypothetical protein HYS13_10375 [Planctomycetia bacterium]|nr:hypothetical protein [Planctomycetia bacterium]